MVPVGEIVKATSPTLFNPKNESHELGACVLAEAQGNGSDAPEATEH